MKIFYVNVIEQNAGWGAECFVNRGLLRNGHHTITLDYRVHRQSLARKFLEVDDFDVFFLQRAEGFPIKLLKAVNRPRFFWASELVSRCRDQDPLLASGLFEHIFVHSQQCKKTVVNKGWQSAECVSVLLNGFDETVQYRIPNIRKDIDVLFVGNILPRRRLWLDSLKKYFNIVEQNVYGQEMTKLFNRSKIVLNIHAEDYLDTETRIFEALGCGSFVLTERLSSESPFSSGIHLVEVDNIDEMVEKIDYYLKNDDIREAIASQGYAEAISNHTYTIRAEEITSYFQKHLRQYVGPALKHGLIKSYARRQLVYNSVNGLKHKLARAKLKNIKLQSRS